MFLSHSSLGVVLVLILVLLIALDAEYFNYEEDDDAATALSGPEFAPLNLPQK